MSQENVEIVRRWLDAGADALSLENPLAAFAEVADRFMTHDVVYEEDPIWPDAGIFRGRDAVSRRYVEYRDLVHLDSIEPGEVTDAGDLVLARVRIEMLGGDDGQALDFLWTYTVRVEDGRISHFRAWYDPDEAARAAGLRD